MPLLVRSACLTGYAELARSLGLDPYRLVKEAGLDYACLIDPECKIPVAAASRLLELSAAAARAEDFGLRLAAGRRLSNLGPFALGIRDAGTLRQALESGARYLQLHNEGLRISLVPIDDLVIFKVERVGGDGMHERQGMELSVAISHGLIRQLRGAAWRSAPVWFSHRAPANMATHLRVFGPWVEFNRECNGILLEVSDLDMPLATADPAMSRHVKQYLEPLLAPAGLTDQVRQLAYELLPSGRCTAKNVAARLGMSRKTLYRQLAQDGETISSIVKATRTALARRYVENETRSLTEIADMLGFSALSAFSRWFRAEFACSPMSYRAANLKREATVQ